MSRSSRATKFDRLACGRTAEAAKSASPCRGPFPKTRHPSSVLRVIATCRRPAQRDGVHYRSAIRRRLMCSSACHAWQGLVERSANFGRHASSVDYPDERQDKPAHVGDPPCTGQRCCDRVSERPVPAEILSHIRPSEFPVPDRNQCADYGLILVDASSPAANKALSPSWDLVYPSVDERQPVTACSQSYGFALDRR